MENNETLDKNLTQQQEEGEIEAITSRSLSPGRMVLKRFFRSKLSLAGLIIIIALFVFSFIGPLFNFLPFVWGEKEKEDGTNAVVTEYTTPTELLDANGNAVLDENGDPVTIYVVTYT
ncbi:MAG: hypothetical protein K2O67_02035, partial [Clostridia bacterium]|nr:hypothetical protein [Clostridia bacterium]